ncbi:MAG: cyclic lactone autoinducer peptide [Lachnospiraceae bacterium]|nr:cyclic lactone autoinducer peptide [Lachnospiraceae bacterium]
MKKDKKIKRVALKVVERILRNEVKKDQWGGDPPICFGIGHQPKRPKREAN